MHDGMVVVVNGLDMWRHLGGPKDTLNGLAQHFLTSQVESDWPHTLQPVRTVTCIDSHSYFPISTDKMKRLKPGSSRMHPNYKRAIRLSRTLCNILFVSFYLSAIGPSTNKDFATAPPCLLMPKNLSRTAFLAN